MKHVFVAVVACACRRRQLGGPESSAYSVECRLAVRHQPRRPRPARPMVIQKVIVRVNGEDLHADGADAAPDPDACGSRTSARCATPRIFRPKLGCARRSPRSRPTILVEAVDELLHRPARPRAGHQVHRRAVQEALDNIKKENKLDDAALTKALQQEGLTLRAAAELRTIVAACAACSSRRSCRHDASPRKRSGSTTRRTRRVHDAGDGHAARDLRVGAVRPRRASASASTRK